MGIGDIVTWNGLDVNQGKPGMVIRIAAPQVHDPPSVGQPWRKRYIVRWFDTWDADPLGYRYEELNTVSKACDT